MIRESVFQQLRDALRQAVVIDRAGYPVALVIDGRCLMFALDPLMRGTLLQLGVLCRAVVCCRVSPLQKAQVSVPWRITPCLTWWLLEKAEARVGHRGSAWRNLVCKSRLVDLPHAPFASQVPQGPVQGGLAWTGLWKACTWAESGV